MNKPFLRIKNISKIFKLKSNDKICALKNVSFNIYPNEIIGLVGQSGSGKSTLASILSGLFTASSGSIDLYEKNIQDYKFTRQKYNSQIYLLFQDYGSIFNPRMTVKQILDEMLQLYNPKLNKTEYIFYINDLLKKVKLSSSLLSFFPHELSGGQKQRLNIARCLIIKPKLIIIDEAISALDFSLQAQIINLLLDLQTHEKSSLLFISHDLNLLYCICHKIGILFDGQLIEYDLSQNIFNNPKTQYTKDLINAIPTLDPINERFILDKNFNTNL